MFLHKITAKKVSIIKQS